MKIKNKTSYRSDDLRKIFLQGLKEEGVSPKGYLIRVENSKGSRGSNCVYGYGWYNRSKVQLNLPKEVKKMYCGHTPPVTIEEKNKRFLKRLAQVFVHEIGHNLNLHHKEMVSSSTIDVSWVDGMELRQREPKTKLKVDVKVIRFERVKKMLAKHETVLKREQKLVRKYRQKVRYYERTFEKAACDVKEQR